MVKGRENLKIEERERTPVTPTTPTTLITSSVPSTLMLESTKILRIRLPKRLPRKSKIAAII